MSDKVHSHKQLICLSEEALKSILRDFGITESESSVYLFLARHTALKGTEIAQQLKKDKAQIYHILRELQSKGIVESTLETPMRFTATPFENIVESAIKAKKDEAAKIENAKLQLLDYWKETSKPQVTVSAEKFVVIESRQRVYSKIAQMIAATESQLLIIAAVSSLLRADKFGLYDVATKHPKKAKIIFRFLTKLSEKNVDSAKILCRELSLCKMNCSIRVPDLDANLSPRMVIKDDREALFFITPPSKPSTEEFDESCLWTNCIDLVQAFTKVFEGTWLNSTDVQTRIREIEGVKSSSKTIIIADTKLATEKYEEALGSVHKEIVAIISQERFIALSKNKALLKNWLENGVRVRILTPITSATQEAAKHLRKNIEVRHVPSDCMEIAAIDNNHLFEFRNNLQETTHRASPNLRNTVYSNDSEYIQKTKRMLDNTWQIARKLSATSLSSISQTQKVAESSLLKETVP